ncbi:MAG: ABC transporter permease [Propionibacteriaceae bacterium]|nr:ABC transporter permease [Propionibacteriaceae bacterium]
MISFVVKRLAVAVVSLFGISIVLFLILRLAPGDPVSMFFNPMEFYGDREAAMALRRAQLGLDRPLPVQYAAWLGQLFQGNLGVSYQTGRPVLELLQTRLGATSLLMLSSLAISLVIGVTAGIFSALKRNSAFDYTASFLSVSAISIPPFFLALLGIFVFGLQLRVLPTAGINTPGGDWGDALRHLILPAGILGISSAAGYVRWARSSLLDVLLQDFMVTAQSKGLSSFRVVVGHGLRNALIPLITVVATGIPSLFGGSVIIEQIFAWPGTGRMAVDAIANRDYAVLMGFLMMTAVLVLVCNLLADLAYALVDPRVRL